MQKIIAPSILAADVLNLEQEITSLLPLGLSWLHLDIMDNHFVPNLSFGPMFCQALHAKWPTLHIDVHLMLSNPYAMTQSFLQAGAKSISVHAEIDNPALSLTLIKEHGALAGLAVKPKTPLSAWQHLVPLLDYVLILGVEPGFAGQQLLVETQEKISACRKILPPQVLIEVDGGVDGSNIVSLAYAGADIMVAGKAVFSGVSTANYRQLTNLLTNL